VTPAPPVPTGNVYPKYAARSWPERVVVGRFLGALDRAVRQAVDGTPDRVLELGTGEGEIARRLRSRFPAATLVTLDLPDAELAEHWRGGGWSSLFADAAHAPVADATVDLVLAIEVLEHLVDPAAALAEMARVARGAVVLSVPCEPLWRVANMARGRHLAALGNTPGHLQHWGRRRFASLVGRHLDVVEVVSPLPWTMVVARSRRAAAATRDRAARTMPAPLPGRRSP
jgi:SAM-dependent methyltransferase